ncbi:metal transporter [Streptomyces sp. NPDC014894]|uniref:metal transporter n=1 Tax=Streptomyces sp. NPDC014894 TaxID=3364931 RepID=UPI0037010BCE
MDRGDRPAGPADRMFTVGLGGVFALGIAFTAFMFMTSWGGVSWVFGSAVSTVVGCLALTRGRRGIPIVCAGLAVTSLAVAVSLIAGDELPREPAPVTALALSVLVGSAIRALPAGPAAGIAAGGVAVAGAGWLEGPSGVAILATAGMTAALVTGAALRAFDRGGRADAPAAHGSRSDRP